MPLDLPELTKPMYTPKPPPPPVWRFVGPQARPPEFGTVWLRSAFQIFRRDPLSWVFKFLGSFGFLLLLGGIPGIGEWAGIFVYPILGWWVFITSQEHERTLPAAPRTYPDIRSIISPLLLLGLISTALSNGLSAFVTELTGFSAETLPELKPEDPKNLELIGDIAEVMLLHTLLSLPLTMATYFAPPLMALENMSLIDALKLSFVACIRNIIPLGWNVTLVLGIGAASMLLGGLPLLVLAPVFLIMLYTTYLDIFMRLEAQDESESSD